MTPERWHEIKEVFLGSLDRPASERPEFLAGACAGDSDLQQQVEALLADHELADTFIEPPPQVDNSLPKSGREIGPYRILEKIDEGGMGAVYLAKRADAQYSQQVAIKLIRRGMASELLVARFRQERQILAHLDHPGIARLLDGGTTDDDQPYLVMEFIEGEPINDYCERHHLTIEQRLELFRKVCAAVHYAHQNLVIHRDIKPNNILVTVTGEPKLLDFGTAKLLEPALAEPGLASTLTGQRLMTPEYASPEQLRAEPITTASDVYALGVVLYELLTGRRPYRFASRHSPEVLRVVCEQEPEKPSTAVSRPATEVVEGEAGDNADRATPVTPSRTRHGLAVKLSRRLRGDLDNIVLMALRKEPERRYASVEQLSEDLRRHLEGLPVVARRDTWPYHLGKFVGRHRFGVTASLLAILTVFVAAMTAFWQARLAERERLKAEQVTRLLVNVYDVSNPRRDAISPESLERSEARARTELGDQPEVLATLLDTLGVAYQKIGLYEPAGAHLQEALELRQQSVGDRHPETATSWAHLGRLALEQANHDRAEKLLQRALELYDQLLDPDDPRVAEGLNDLGRLRYQQGRFEAAEDLHRQTLAKRRQVHGEQSPEVAESLNNLATALWATGRVAEAEDLLRQVLDLRRQLFGRRHPDVTNSLNNLAVLLFNQENHAAAEELATEALEIDRELFGERHVNLARDLDLLATIRLRQERFDEAEPLYRRALVIQRDLYAPDLHPDMAYSFHSLGAIMQKQKRYDEALDFYQQALDLRRELLTEDHPDLAFSYASLAQLLGTVGRHREARDPYLRALAIHRSRHPLDQRAIAKIERGLAESQAALERSG
ncbi:MAG: serine/threonine-protein kinase [Acidobacteriota bacterium]